MTVLIQGSQLRALLLGVRVERPAEALPQTADKALFNITGGRVLITSIVGEVTTAIQNQLNNTKLKFNPTAVGADVDLCAVLDIANDAVGTLYTITGTFATAMQGATVLAVGSNAMLQKPLLLSEGAIELDCAASNTGAVGWTVTYIPLDDGASVAVA